jgi:serpin B
LGFALGSAVFASPNAEVASNAQNKMGWKLFDKTLQVAAEKNEKNVLISPTSANIALTMAMQGAKGDTLAEMKSVLAYGDASLVEVHQALNELMVSLEKKPTVEMDEGTSQRLSIANKIWSNKKEFSINPEFTVLMNQYYQRNASEEIIKEVEEFVPTAVVAEVNSWVAKKTENMIQKLLSESAIDEDTRMILVNALYFQAQWLNKFSAVADFDFTNIDGKTNAVPAIRG